MLRLVLKNLIPCLAFQRVTVFRMLTQDYDKNVIRKYKHLQSDRHPDLVIYKKQLLYRASRMGQKELELIIANWLRHNMDKMTYEELNKFEDEVLLVDNMVLFNHLFGAKTIANLALDNYIHKVKDFAMQNDKDKKLPE